MHRHLRSSLTTGLAAAHHRSRHTALVLALAGLVALVLASPAGATFAGHNGLIAFHSGTDKGAQIFTVRPNGRDLRQITHVSGEAIGPDWSPDGQLIAFDIETADSAQPGADPAGRRRSVSRHSRSRWLSASRSPRRLPPGASHAALRYQPTGPRATRQC